MISWNTTIYCDNMDHNIKSVTAYPPYFWKRIFGTSDRNRYADNRIRIGNNVWIGAGAIILAGVSIGDCAIIGAGSVVTKDIEPYTIVAGNPAKKLRMRFSNTIIALLEKLEWYNLPKETLGQFEKILCSEDADEVKIQKLIDIKMQ